MRIVGFIFELFYQIRTCSEMLFFNLPIKYVTLYSPVVVVTFG
jgi:hypothetical protein